MRIEEAKTAVRWGRATVRHRTITASVVTLAGLAAGGAFGAGVSAGQYGPYPPPTSSPPASSAPTHKRAKNTVVIKGASSAT
jgi:hypothetical protein